MVTQDLSTLRAVGDPTQGASAESTPVAAVGKTHLHGRITPALLAVGVVLLGFSLAGCGEVNSATAPASPAAVPVRVETVVEREVTDWDTFTGRFEAIDSVKLRPRVSGYIDAVTFVEGEEVEQGDILFVIDPRPYRLRLDHAQAQLARAWAQSELARTELTRTRGLLATRAVSQEEFDRRASQHSQSLADVQAAQAAVDTAQLDLEYTRVVSPIDGRVSRADVTTGNYVNAGDTVLTSVVSLDPIHVAFEGDEQTFLKYKALARRGERPHSRDNSTTPVNIGLANESDFPHVATMNFVDNALNPETGTIRMRALIHNPQRLFTPGMMARVRLQSSGRYTAPVIEESAIGTDQDRKYVMVVSSEGVAEYRAVELGGIYQQGRVVRDGVNAGERIIIGGLQRVRPGTLVKAEEAGAATTNQTAAAH